MTKSLTGPAPAAEKVYLAFALVAAALLMVEVETGIKLALAQSLSGIIFEPTGFQVGRDFINTWMGARSAFAGGPAPWFDFNAYNEAVRQVSGHPDLPPLFWSYPPQILLFIWPFGLLPYLPAYLLWCTVGLAVYLWAAIAGGVERRHVAFLAVAPAVAVSVFFGQNGFLTAALLIGGLANLDRRPLVAGILFGILTCKPQFGLLLPVLLVMTGRWRVIAAAVASAAVLVVVTSLWFGPDIWVQYWQKVAPQQHWLLTTAGDHGWPIVSSAFVNARLVGLSDGWAWAVQGLSSCCALAAVVWTFWRRRDPVLSLALFVTATFLFSPWMLNYDMVVFAFVVALLRQRDDNSAADHGLALAIWTLPVLMVPFGFSHIPLALIVLPAFAGRLIWRLAR
ncbi:MAG TPA: glycosyltransferase family 87 protein, partial [Candidatus Sulfotelmatobacter sp.]|nr:glycosyltransferase family 87 protein [Candidatus Sulfotelmatobacter sp.]